MTITLGKGQLQYGSANTYPDGSKREVKDALGMYYGSPYRGEESQYDYERYSTSYWDEDLNGVDPTILLFHLEDDARERLDRAVHARLARSFKGKLKLPSYEECFEQYDFLTKRGLVAYYYYDDAPDGGTEIVVYIGKPKGKRFPTK